MINTIDKPLVEMNKKRKKERKLKIIKSGMVCEYTFKKNPNRLILFMNIDTNVLNSSKKLNPAHQKKRDIKHQVGFISEMQV